MALSRISRRVLEWLGRPLRAEQSANVRAHGPRTHVIILDGTMSTLEPGHETHAGMFYRLCMETGPSVSVYYEAGIQWTSWRNTAHVLVGKGLNAQIRRAYGCLASRYRPGDRIFLIGFSRGAYAVRSLAGVIDMVGLVRAEHANVRNIRTAYRHYECTPASDVAQAFRRIYCHDSVPIEMVGVWDTVKALGLRLPILWRFAVARHAFHSHQLGPSIRNGFHALALNETRAAFAPVTWSCAPDWPGHVEQVWFRGAHGDIGGQLNGFESARPLANIPLVWMLDRAEVCGLPLPDNWRARFYTDVSARSVGTWRGWAKIFLVRRHRRVGEDRSERLHESVAVLQSGHPGQQSDPSPTT
jgi:uncharacterized protein (DUF2235 family)